MAGFAVFMTILAYGAASLAATIVASLAFHFYTRWKLPGDEPRRASWLFRLTAAPFLALVWLVFVLLLHVQISNRLAHQDCGLSPDPYVTLPNGYLLGSANTYSGYVHAPGVRMEALGGRGYARSVVDLRLQNGIFSGSQFDFTTSRVRNFTLDTYSQAYHADDLSNGLGSQCKTSDPTCLEAWSAAQTGTHTSPHSYWNMYQHYRHAWPRYILLILIVSGEIAIGTWTWRQLRRLNALVLR